MKNIFVTACYKVTHMYGHATYEDYKKLTDLCLHSFLKNLNGMTDVQVLTGVAVDFNQLFKKLFLDIKIIYQNNQPCNIVFADSDTICLRPIEIFGKWDKFAMFNTKVGEPYQHSYINSACLSLVKNLTPWMMANIRYYPSGLPNFLWDIADDLAYSWVDEWAYDCIIYNKMFHSQGITDYSPYHNPWWNTLILGGITDAQIDNSEIIHCAGTRGTSLAIENINKALRRV